MNQWIRSLVILRKLNLVKAKVYLNTSGKKQLIVFDLSAETSMH